ncbi:hypothetical protein AXF42_Ash011338 [Apostasia shenzhenica]|uniref:PSP proline-rich domain-containing protein n=1 Tax=Apostasia shenzhenica TaxID=1088818 RepID=A0A2I0AE91_9ASPA|nr:hypothetical protein AXF42_Ash011338 [Apostasia shenzhenica]
MASDDFIKLDSCCDSDKEKEDCVVNDSSSKEAIANQSNSEVQCTTNGNNSDPAHVQDMDVEEVDITSKQFIVHENIQSLDEVNELDHKHAENVISTHAKLLVDQNPIIGVKRARIADNDQQPSVHVVYKCLTRESKNKLAELMQQWSEWQAKHQSSSNGTLDSGEQTYFPSLQFGSDNSVSYCLDNQWSREHTFMDSTNCVNLHSEVPLYDRGFTLGSTSLDGSTNTEGETEILEASRCFNCGSYSHSFKECTKPRDNVAINNARKQHSAKRNYTPGSQVQVRYYQKPSGKFDDLKPGVLGPETRECLGIGEFDPPPWLHRMRELGYPPGYLDYAEEDQSSGITIFGDSELKNSEPTDNADGEEGELPERAEPVPPKKMMIVSFPGINVPIPENADASVWSAPLVSSYRSSSRSRSIRSSWDPLYSNDHRDNGPPGSDHGFAAFSQPGYSPRYSPHDHNAIPRSPCLGRSLSDRSWGSPLPYESSPIHSPHSPYPYPNRVQQSPHHYSQSSNSGRWNRDYSSSDSRDRDRERDRYVHHPRHNR